MNEALKFEIIKSHRKGYEIEKLARLPATKLSRIINGPTDPSPDEMSRIAEVLRKPVAELFPSSSKPVGAT